jgi:polyhydroxyalkanoate synthase
MGVPPGTELAELWKCLANIGVPPEALAAAQRDYVSEAATIWNRLLRPSGEAPRAERPPLREPRLGVESRVGVRRRDVPPQRAHAGAARQERRGRPKTQARIRFAVLQWIDAAAPSNFLALNPEAQKKAIETNGESLLHGLTQLWDDTQRGHLSQTDESAFEVGRNVATTSGAVIFENEFFQLLEYTPLTAKVTSGRSCSCRRASTSSTSSTCSPRTR